MSINHCPFGNYHGEAKPVPDDKYISCSHEVCRGQYWFKQVAGRSYPQQKIDDILKALHDNITKNNKDAWKKLKELGFGRIYVNSPDLAGTGSVFQRKANDLWDMKKVMIPKNFSSEYEEYELCYNPKGKQYQYKYKDAEETKNTPPKTIKFHIGRVYTTFFIDGVLERFTTPHEVSDILFETTGKKTTKLTLDAMKQP